MALTRADLDTQGCDEAGCTHDHSVLFVHPRCHRHAHTVASYHKARGTLVIRCGRCQELVVEVEVAKGGGRAVLSKVR